MSLELINNLNLIHLRIFESVYRLKSMTLAAQELFLTQSGVSQHMKNLEESLGISLFVRNRSGLFTTEEADLLYKSYKKAFGEIEQTLKLIKDPQQQQLTGTLKIGLPTEFGNNILIPLVADWAKKYTKVKFDFSYGYGAALIEQLESGQIDLAFIDSIQKNKKIKSQVVFQENLLLVASDNYLKQTNKQNQSLNKIHNQKIEKEKDLLNLDFLEYEHKESILRLWFGYHYGKKNIHLNIKAWAMNVQGVASLMKQGLGAAILPDHLVEKLIKQGHNLHIFKGKKANLKNDISVVWIKNKPQSQATEELLNFILNNNKN